MTPTGPWAVLGIAPTSDRVAIRRAYAARLKDAHPEDDPAGFQTLRAAYEQVLRMAERGFVAARWAPTFEEDADEDEDEDEDEEPDEDDFDVLEVEPSDEADTVPARVMAWTEEVAEPDLEPQPEPEPEPEVKPEPKVRQPRAWTEKVDPEPEPNTKSAPKAKPETRAWTEKLAIAAPKPTSSQRESAAHDADCQRLARMLAADAPPGELALAALGARILGGPAMDQLSVFMRTERWLAGLIISHAPRSDPLVAPAIARFDWRLEERDREANPAAAAVVRRQDDLRYLAQLKLKSHPLHRAWRVLQQPPGRADAVAALLIPGRISDVRQLIGELHSNHPGLQANLPFGVIDAWEGFIGRPRPPAAALWGVLVMGALVALPVAQDRAGSTNADPTTYLTAWLGLTGAGFGLMALKQFAMDYPAWLWRRRWRAGAPEWLALGWAPAALANLAFAAVAPSALAGEIALGLTSLAVVVWAAITGERLQPGRSRWPWPVRLGARNALVALLWMMLGLHRHGDGPQGGALAAGAAAIAWGFGEQSLIDLWQRRLSRRARYGTIAALLVAGAAIAAALAPSGVKQPAPALALALTALALLQRLPASTARPFAPNFNLTGRNVFGLIWMLMVGGSVLLGVAAAAVVIAAALSSWTILAGCAFGLIRAAWRERRDAKA